MMLKQFENTAHLLHLNRACVLVRPHASASMEQFISFIIFILFLNSNLKMLKETSSASHRKLFVCVYCCKGSMGTQWYSCRTFVQVQYILLS